MALYNGKTGVWRTKGGKHIFIEDGKDLIQAMKESGKYPIKKDDTPSYKRNSEINHNIKHLQAQIESSRDDIRKNEDLLRREISLNGELSQKAREYEDLIRHDEQYINYRNADIANLEKSRLANDMRNEFGIEITNPQLQRLREIGDVEENQRYFENAYIKHKNARAELNKYGAENAPSKVWNDDVFANEDYNLQKRIYTNFYGEDATDEMIKRSQETLDRSSLSRDGFKTKKSQDNILNKKSVVDENEFPEWLEVGSKYVQDSDGFTTDYTLYLNTKDGKMATVFGDKELYNVDTGTDMDFDTPEEAWDWFNNYEGFKEESKSKKIMTRDEYEKEMSLDPHKLDYNETSYESYLDSLEDSGVNKKEIEALEEKFGKRYNDENETVVNGIKLLKPRQNEKGTYIEDLINTYNKNAREGKGNYKSYQSIKKEIAERRKNNSILEEYKRYMREHPESVMDVDTFKKNIEWYRKRK